MLNRLEQKIFDFIKANELFCSADRILLSVSGGADSTALLNAMGALGEYGAISFGFVVVHINHQLRGDESDGDEQFVIAEAAKLNMPVITRRVDVSGFARKNKLSIETAARQLRIEALLDIAKANDIKWVTTAHHADDNAETIIHRLVRGTGFRGLAGIRPMRTFGNNIRFASPLLTVRKQEIVQYLKQQNLGWRTDQTNKDCKYKRNFIRHRLLPAIQEESKESISDLLTKLSQSARCFHDKVCNSTNKIWPQLTTFRKDEVDFDLKLFVMQPESVQIELIRKGLSILGSGEQNLTHKHYEWILQLAEENIGGRRIELPGGFIVDREYGKLIFNTPSKKEELETVILDKKKLKVPGQTRFGNYLIEAVVFDATIKVFEEIKGGKNSFVECFDLDKIDQPLMIRSRCLGDKFIPLGLPEEKKIGKFLTDAKVPRRIRKNTLVVADSKKTIWLWPIRISEESKVTGQTGKILQLQITNADNN